MATDTIQSSSPPPIDRDQHVDSRDFRIAAISILSADGTTRDITAVVQELQVRQDMYLTFMSGEALITDAADMLSQTALHGNEYLLIHITEPEQDVCIKKAFRIYKVGERVAAQNNSQRFVIYFCSDELFISNSIRFSKAYQSALVSDIAQDIIQNHLKVPQDRITIEPTQDAQTIVLPYMRPAAALEWLASRAYADDSSCFLFYENLNGFNFRSLQSIYKDGTVIKVPFKLEQKSVDKAIGMDKYAIDSFDSKRDFDTLKLLTSGGVALGLMAVDSTYRTYDVTEYSLKDIPTLYKNSLITNPKDGGKSLFEKSGAHFLTYLKSVGVEKWIKRVMSFATLTNNALELVLPGSVRLQVGTLISVRFPYASTPVDGDMWDKRKSGKYLIIAVNHKFDLVQHKFDTILMVTRDSLPEALPPVDTKLPDKVKSINNKSHRD